MTKKNKQVVIKRYVVQRNELLYGNTTVFNVTDLKIFKLIISKVNSKNILFDEFYEISNEELKELNINEKHLYQTTLNSLKKLANVYMKIEPDQETIKEVGLIQNNFKFKKYSNKFYISFHQDMKDYLLDIQEKYTRYPLEDIKDLKLKHSIKFYEYLKSISFDEIKISIEKLKQRLDIPVTSYEKFAMFKKKVIEPVLQEINQKTQLNISYEPIKDGRKIIQLKIFINKKMNNFVEIEKKPLNMFQKYLNKTFIHQEIKHQIININEKNYYAEVKNLENGDIGKINSQNNDELLEKLKQIVD